MFIGVEDITQSTATSGEIRVTLGDSRVPAGVAQETPIWGNGGFVSRPVDPDEAGAAQGLYINDGNKRRVIAWRDNRYAENAGSLEPGESAIVCDRDARVMVKSSTNTVVLFTVNAMDKNAANANTSMMVLLDGDNGKLKLMCGKSWIEVSASGIVLGTEKSTLALDGDGVHINGSHFGCNTLTGNLGVVAPGVAPPQGAASVQFGPAVGIPSTRWTVAP